MAPTQHMCCILLSDHYKNRLLHFFSCPFLSPLASIVRLCLKRFLLEFLLLGTLALLCVLPSLNHKIHLSDEAVKTEQLNHCKRTLISVSYTD